MNNKLGIIGVKWCSQTSLTATFLVDSPYIHSRSNLSTMATFFCPQGGHCGEV